MRVAQVAELVDALVSNTNGKPCRFDPGPGYSRELRLNTNRNYVAHENLRRALALKIKYRYAST